MDVRFNRVDEGEAVSASRGDIGVDVATRVDNRGFTGPGTRDEVRALGQPLVEEPVKHRVESPHAPSRIIAPGVVRTGAAAPL